MPHAAGHTLNYAADPGIGLASRSSKTLHLSKNGKVSTIAGVHFCSARGHGLNIGRDYQYMIQSGVFLAADFDEKFKGLAEKFSSSALINESYRDFASELVREGQLIQSALYGFNVVRAEKDRPAVLGCIDRSVHHFQELDGNETGDLDALDTVSHAALISTSGRPLINVHYDCYSGDRAHRLKPRRRGLAEQSVLPNSAAQEEPPYYEAQDEQRVLADDAGDRGEQSHSAKLSQNTGGVK